MQSINDRPEYASLRVFVDTCSLVTYALGAQQTMGSVVAHWRADDFVMLTSPSIRDELSRIADSLPIQGMSDVHLGRMALGLERFAELIPGPLAPLGLHIGASVAGILRCAVQGEAHYLVTNNRNLLALRRHGGVGIVTPGQLLLALEMRRLSREEISDRLGPETVRDIRNAVCLDPDTDARLMQVISEHT